MASCFITGSNSILSRMEMSGSLSFPWFCLVETKIWKDGPALQPSDRPALQLSDGPVLQLCVTDQFYLESKGKYILEVWGLTDPKDVKGKEAPSPILAPLFIWSFLLPLGLPYVNWLARSAVCFNWGPHSGPWTFLCSIFVGFSLPCLLATAILDSFFLF